MPMPGKRWWHATIGTHGSWLPGDPRGFRDRKHRIHSSGDHRNPPPAGEHQRLHQRSQSISNQPRIVPHHLREKLGLNVLQRLEKQNHRVLILSVAGMHVHGLIELPADYQTARTEIGKAKRVVSLAMRDDMPGRIWAGGCGLKWINDEQHHRNTFNYILKHRDEGAWLWTFREEIGGAGETRT